MNAVMERPAESDAPLPTVTLLGLPVHRLTMPAALDLLDGFVRARTPHHIVTADASMLVMAQDDPELHDIILRADLVTPDSTGVLWAAKRADKPIAERVSGVVLVEKLCALSAERDYRLFFLGAAPGVAEQAAKRMSEKYPGCQVVGTRDGFFAPEEEGQIVQNIRDSHADIVCVAMGIPKQEKWIARHRHELGASVLIGVGGTLDVLSGTVKRAPVVFQKLHLEWLWRVVSNPKKISKVMLLPQFVKIILREKPNR
jgi:N-acetylglucosaminyldiphosphoundecaprenol N-acetyl-beta-D-mannosaminyltransferase